MQWSTLVQWLLCYVSWALSVFGVGGLCRWLQEASAETTKLSAMRSCSPWYPGPGLVLRVEVYS